MNEHIFSQGTKIRPLWGTTQLFMHPCYMHGGATINRMPLIGRAVDDHDMKRVLELLKNDPNYVSRTGPKEWAKKFRNDAKEKDDAEMLKTMSFYGEVVVTALGSEVDRLEKEIQETVPGIRHVDIEAHNPIIPPP
ncbi:putative Zinc transporter 9 [Helianthus anomalus]